MSNYNFKLYDIYYNGTKVGESYAVSPAKAINNFRYKNYGNYSYKNSQFKAIEKEDN